MKWDYALDEDLKAPVDGLFITCEGNFQYGNATLSYYDPATRTVQNEVFYRANGMKLGDVAESMIMHGGRGWIVVNNSHVVFAIDPADFRETGRITGLTSPRYIHFIDDTKAYISQLWDNRIFIVDTRRYEITGHITVPGMAPESGSTEQMVRWGDYVLCNCWSYQNRIIKIDTRSNEVVAELNVGVQPRSIALDCHGRLWVLTDGGFEENPAGHERPSLLRVEPGSMTIQRRFRFDMDDTPSRIVTNAAADTIYWINRDVWRMPADAEDLPSAPFLREPDRGRYYSLTVSPHNGDVYVADAIDYQQPARVYRYSTEGDLIDMFNTGVTPSSFCWR